MAAAIQLHEYVEAISKDHFAGRGAFHKWLRRRRSRTTTAPAATGSCDRSRGSAVLPSRPLVVCEWISPLLGRRPLAYASPRARLGARNLSAPVAGGSCS